MFGEIQTLAEQENAYAQYILGMHPHGIAPGGQEPRQLAERRIYYQDARVAQPYLQRSYLAPERDSGAQEEAAALVMRNVIAGDPSDEALKDSCIPELAPLGTSDTLLLLRYSKNTTAARAYWERALRSDP